MAHKKAGGSTRLGRDSNPQFLGVKVGNNQAVNAGMVLVTQRGTPITPGKNVKKGTNDTLFAAVPGIVKFSEKNRTRFDGRRKRTTFVEIIPAKA
jgi:large subunit ribosomal protein L27